MEKLDKFSLSFADCRGQSYDNSSNMMGYKQGVQARVLQMKALHVPCSSYSLNLVVTDAAKSSIASINHFLWCSPECTIFFLLCAVLGSFTGTCQINCKIFVSDQIGSQEWQHESGVLDHTSFVCSPNPANADEGLRDNVHSNQHSR